MRSTVRSVLVGLLSLASARALADPAWSLERSSDPQTGATIATAFTIYREGPLAKGAVVRCRERTLEVYVDLGEPLGRDRAAVFALSGSSQVIGRVLEQCDVAAPKR